MKTANEWMIQEYFNIADVDTSTMLALIKQIQLDAIKEGMRMAAAICDDTSWNKATAILSAAEQLTERDL